MRSAELVRREVRARGADLENATAVRLAYVHSYTSSLLSVFVVVPYGDVAEHLTPQSHHDGSFYISSPAASRSESCGTDSDFSNLSLATLKDLCSVWFERYHPWFPILHKLSVLDTIQSTESLADSPLLMVLKAIVAVTLPHWSLTNPLSEEQRKKLSEQFRKQLILHSISDLSLQSLQAVLIVTIIDFGAGRLSEFWNLVALCKRYDTRTILT
jgi:hypothetical protein